MFQIIRLAALAATFALNANAVLASETIRNIPRTPHFASPTTPIESIAAAIKLAAGDYQWRILEEQEGELLASVFVRQKHRATVRIGFDEASYWIDYVDSENLDFSPNDRRLVTSKNRGVVIKGPRIHRNYNRWVANLARQIEVRMQAPPEVDIQPSPTFSVADEIEKLDDLKQRGVLSSEEFNELKKGILRKFSDRP